MESARWRLGALLIAIASLPGWCPVAGQEFRATLTGRVLDPSEAPIMGASISVRNESTNVVYPAKTDARGNYTTLLLPPGSYTVTASAAGFKQATASGVTLNVAKASTQDFKLEIGAVSQAVTVAAETPLLDQVSADRGALVNAETVTEIPLSGRNPFMLGQLVPGVDFNGSFTGQRPFDNGSINNWNVNGSNGKNEFLLDGAPNNAQSGSNNIAYVPPVDSVQEFRIQTNSYSAQYGKTGGGIINVALKSGGNLLPVLCKLA